MASTLSCKSCSKSFSDPRLLPCLHVFCKDCLEPLYSQDEGTITCPTCNKTSSCKPPAQLPRHLRIERDSTLSCIQQSPQETLCGSCIENNKAEAYCEDCSSPICSDCISSHKRLRNFVHHSIISLTQSQPVAAKRVSCILHPEKAVEYYCSTCSCLVCSKCLFTHKEHEWCPFENTELFKTEKDELQSVLPQVEEAISPIVKAARNIDDVVNCIRGNKDQAKREINKAFKQIADAVENRRLELIQEVDNSAIAKSTRLEMQKEGLDKISTGLQLALESGNTACKEYSSTEVLAVKGTIFKASNDLLQESRSIYLLSVSNGSLSVAIDNTQLIESISSFGSIVTASSYPPLCSLIDINPKLAIGAAKGSEGAVTLQTRDEKGEDLPKGTAKVLAKVADPSSGSEVSECVVSDLDNGRYEISFNNPTVGQYQLNITIDSVSISPVTINVRDYTAIRNPVTTVNANSSSAYVATSHDNHHYVTFEEGSVKVYNSNMAEVREIPQSKLGGNWLRGIAIDDQNGVMFVASAVTNQIIKATLEGEVIASVGTEGTGELQFFPMGLCLTRDGLLLVAEGNNMRVQVLGSDLSFIRFIPCLSRVRGVSVDDNGNIHAAVYNKGVKVFSITGEKITEYGQGVLTRAGDVAFLPCSKSRYSFVTDHTTPGKVCIFDWSNNTLIHTIKCSGRNLGLTIDQEGSVIVCGWSCMKIYKL